MPDYSFGEILKQYREQHDNMSQQELADILGTTKQVISRYETGQRDPKISTAKAYAEKLGIPLSALLGGSLPLSHMFSPFSPEKLIEMRSDRGLSPDDVSRICDIPLDVYLQIESGAIYPHDTVLQQIASGLNSSLDALYSFSWDHICRDPHEPGFHKLSDLEYEVIMRLRKFSEEKQRAFLLILTGEETREP